MIVLWNENFSKNILWFYFSNSFKESFINVCINFFINTINGLIQYYFFLIVATYCSPFIRMGADKSFIIYKIFGVMRSEFFLFSINLFLASFFFKLILNNLKKYDLSNASLKVFHEIHLRLGVFMLFLFSSSVFIVDGLQNKFNCFLDTAYSSYPILINNIYDGVLENDFFKNAIQDTPKVFTAWILQIPYILEWIGMMVVYLFIYWRLYIYHYYLLYK